MPGNVFVTLNSLYILVNTAPVTVLWLEVMSCLCQCMGCGFSAVSWNRLGSLFQFYLYSLHVLSPILPVNLYPFFLYPGTYPDAHVMMIWSIRNMILNSPSSGAQEDQRRRPWVWSVLAADLAVPPNVCWGHRRHCPAPSLHPAAAVTAPEPGWVQS